MRVGLEASSDQTVQSNTQISVMLFILRVLLLQSAKVNGDPEEGCPQLNIFVGLKETLPSIESSSVNYSD